MIHFRLIPLAAVVAGVGVSMSAVDAYAAPISYFEQVSGDLPGNGSADTFTLDIGLNTVNGTMSSSPTSDFDTFRFIVPEGLEVLSGKLLLTDATGDITSSGWSLTTGPTFNNVFVESVVAVSPGFTSFANGTLPAGNYTLFHGSIGSAGTANYTFIFDVHQPLAVVPEPASVALLAVAGVAMLGRRRA